MKKRYDIIIIGGGHNGLVAAAYLAQAGKKVLLLEKRPSLGGVAATEELWPGFRVNIGAEDAGLFQPKIVQELFLKMHGLEWRESEVALFVPQVDGRSLTLYRDVDRTAAALAAVSQTDAASYSRFARQVEQFTAVLREMMLQIPPHLAERNLSELVSWGNVGLKLRRLGKQPMMAFMRVLPMPAREYLDNWFENDLLKGALGLDAVTGLMQGPRAAGTTLMLLYQHVNGLWAQPRVLGGLGHLSTALANAAQQHGAEIRTGAGVVRVQLDGGRATAVLLENGDQIPAQVIVSNVDPRQTLFGLVGPQALPPTVMRAVRTMRYQGSTAKLLLALDRLPAFVGQTHAEQVNGRIRICPSLDYLEKAFDAAKYGRFAPNLALDITIPTALDATLAPPDQHIMSITARYAPYALRQESWETQCEALAEAILATLTPYAPELRASIQQQHLITPLAYEQTYGLTEGSIHHGQMALDQLLVMRPVPGWARYQTPIENLYLCGAGTHPGGGVTGAPGYNAAKLILENLD